MKIPFPVSPKQPSFLQEGLRRVAGEPYRIFFVSGTLWSVVAVLLWPLFYGGKLGFYPAVTHSRLMIEAFGGAFVAGFLGTAGPRMADAPLLSKWEFGSLFLLHQLSAFSHLALHAAAGDALFAGMLILLLTVLTARVVKFRAELPPPQMLLAVCGIGCGIAGSLMPWVQRSAPAEAYSRLAGLLLNQGFLLLPVLGIGSFIFPRMLGGNFGDPVGIQSRVTKLRKSAGAAVLIFLSFLWEARGGGIAATGLRAGVFAAYLLSEVRWRRGDDESRGSLSAGLGWALALGAIGLTLTYTRGEAHRISISHLLYVAGFGLLMLLVGSRVLFGHSGDLTGFTRRSVWGRLLIFLGVLTALTRATPAWLPSTTVSHHIYAAWMWAVLVLGWLLWHRGRFLTFEKE